MELLQMMIVEDEAILREGIRRIGDWNSCGIDICGVAANGVEALKLIEKNKPDIILTDVKMPIMDGIELARRVYEQYPSIRLIILSGHEEFQYAKKAIEYRVSRYLLKPAKIEKIIEAVTEVRDELLVEKRQHEEHEKIREKLKLSMPVLREHYLNRLIASDNVDTQSIEDQFDFYGIELDKEYLIAIVCELDNKTKEDLMQKKIANIRLSEICNEIIGMEYKCCIFNDIKDRVIILLNYKQGIPAKELVVYLTGKSIRIQMEMLSQCGHTVSVGIGRPTRCICHLTKTYKEATSALEYKFFMGNQSVIYIDDVDERDEGEQPYLDNVEAEVITCVKTGDVEGTRKQTEKYFGLLDSLAVSNSTYIFDEIYVLINNTIRMVRRKDEEKDFDVPEELELLRKQLRRNEYTTWRELKEKVQIVLQNTAAKINEDRLCRNMGIIQKAKNYVIEHYAHDVSLITVAEAVYISPNYLSFLFKESGENFKDFVIQVKMKKAEEMLESGNYNLNQIANVIGYKDGRYFSQVYKKYKGEKLIECS